MKLDTLLGIGVAAIFGMVAHEAYLLHDIDVRVARVEQKLTDHMRESTQHTSAQTNQVERLVAR